MALLRRSMLNGICVPYMLSVVSQVMCVGCDAGYGKPALHFERQREPSPVLFQDQAALDVDSRHPSGSIDPATGWPRGSVTDISFSENSGRSGLETTHSSMPKATDATSWDKVKALYR